MPRRPPNRGHARGRLYRARRPYRRRGRCHGSTRGRSILPAGLPRRPLPAGPALERGRVGALPPAGRRRSGGRRRRLLSGRLGRLRRAGGRRAVRGGGLRLRHAPGGPRRRLLGDDESGRLLAARGRYGRRMGTGRGAPGGADDPPADPTAIGGGMRARRRGGSSDDRSPSDVLPGRRWNRAAFEQRPALVEGERDDRKSDRGGRPEQGQGRRPRPFQHAGAQQPDQEARPRRSLCVLVEHRYVHRPAARRYKPRSEITPISIR